MSVNVAYVGPVDGQNSLSLVILDNTRGVEDVNVADLPGLSLQQGPSMCQGDSNLHIFVTDFNDYTIHEIVYDVSSNTFRDVGIVQGAQADDRALTADRTAAVFNPNTQAMHLFFQDHNVLKEAVRTTGGSWTISEVKRANGPMSRCDWGPAACVRGGAINLAFTENNALQVGYLQGGSFHDITPTKNVNIWWSPALINYQSLLFAIFGWQNTYNLNYLTNSEQTGWSSHHEINSYNCADQGPSACIFNNEIFCFSQGTGNRLLYTIYALGSWPYDNTDSGSNFTAVKFKGQTIGNVYYAPAAVSII